MSSFLIKTKLCIPQRRDGSVNRTALVRKLEEGISLNRQLTLISAPPGYGKTSLAVEWTCTSDSDFAWITLDKGDNEPVRFFLYLIEALQSIDNSIGISAQSLLKTPVFPPVDILAGTLINDVALNTRKIILVFDDFQYIHNELINNAIQYLLDNQPGNLHLVIITREDPQFPLSRLRARGQITEIRESDLRFTHDEASEFIYSTMSLNIDVEIVKLLEEKTEGWVSGLQLAALSLMEKDNIYLSRFVREFAGTQRYIFDYLLEEMLDHLNEEIRDFLIQTSIMESFNSSLCDAVTGRNDSAAVLKTLYKSNVFIAPLDNKGQWYRYHALFRDILKSETDKKQRCFLHDKASEWFENNQMFEDAIKHAIASENYNSLERLIPKAAWGMIQRGEIGILNKWLEEIPAKQFDNNPELRMYKAWCLLLSGNGKEAARVISSIDFVELARSKPEIKANLLILQIYRSINVKELAVLKLADEADKLIEHPEPAVRTAALYCIAQVRSLQGKLDESVKYYYQAYNTSLRTKQYFMALISVKNLAFTLLLCGKKKEAINACNGALNCLIDARGVPLPIAEIIYIPLGMAYYLEDNLEQAYVSLQKGIILSRQLALTHFAVQGEMNLALVQYALKDFQGAADTINQLTRAMEMMGMGIVIPVLTVIEAELNLRQGNIEHAKRWAEKMGLTGTHIIGYVDEKQYFMYAKILIAEKKYNEAVELLENLESSALEGGRKIRLITAYILQAIIFKKQNREEQAAAILGKAVLAAAEEGLYRLFLDEDTCITGLLPEIYRLAPEFVGNLINKFNMASIDKSHTGNSDVSRKTLSQPISERELDVMKLISQGFSNQEIADKLFISLGTVKWHITNIFSKLGVKNRVQAVEVMKDFIQK